MTTLKEVEYLNGNNAYVFILYTSRLLPPNQPTVRHIYVIH